jgi:hypothetical protein
MRRGQGGCGSRRSDSDSDSVCVVCSCLCGVVTWPQEPTGGSLETHQSAGDGLIEMEEICGWNGHAPM